jgi:hypothetical protein
MVCIGAARSKPHGSVAKPSRLALHAGQSTIEIDHKVTARVLAEREKERNASRLEREHDRER